MTPEDFLLGVDLGGTKIEAVLLDGSARIMRRRRIATPRDNYAATLDAISRLCARIEAEENIGSPLPLGIGTPGSPSPSTGKMRNCNSTALNGRPLAEDLQHRCERPVRLANDADCFTLSEAIDGAGRDSSSVFGVILGTGVGGGFCIDGNLLSGPNGIAGEWGHNRMPLERVRNLPKALRSSRLCYCGRSDCIETWLSGPGLARTHHALHGVTLDMAALNSDCPDRVHADTLQFYAEMLATALASLINVLDPGVIVLGGGLSNLTTSYGQLPALISHHVFSDAFSTELRAAEHGDSSGVLGAAWLWKEHRPTPHP